MGDRVHGRPLNRRQQGRNMGLFPNMQNVFDISSSRRQGGAEEMGVMHGNMPAMGRDMQSVDAAQMRMHNAMNMNQSVPNHQSGAKRGRTPGTKVLRTCPDCQTQIPAALSKCRHCNHTFREKKQKGARSGKRGKKICPSCQYENPAATSLCKGCNHVFRLKITERYNKMHMNKSNQVQKGVRGAPQPGMQKQHMSAHMRNIPTMSMGEQNINSVSLGMGNTAAMNNGMMANNPYGMPSMQTANANPHQNMVGLNGMGAHGHGFYGMNGMSGIGGMPGLGGGLGGGLGMLNPGVVPGIGAMSGRAAHDGQKMDGAMHRGGR